MSNKKLSRFRLVFSISVLCGGLLAVSGCGGGGGSTSPAASVSGANPVAPTAAGGRMQVVVDWSVPASKNAAASRYVPVYAQSLYFEFYANNDPGTRYQFAINRPGDGSTTQTFTYPTLLPVGAYSAACVARTEAGGQGATVASAAAQFTVANGQTAGVDLTLNSTVKRLTLLRQPLVTQTGVTLAIPVSVTDPDGKSLLLPPNALSWSIVSGGDIGTIDGAGNFTGTADGTARVHVSEDGAGVSAEADVRVANGPYFQVLGQPLVVKAGSASGTTLQLQAATVAPGGTPNAFPPGTLVWSVISGTDYGTVTPDGLFTGTGDGVARVRVMQTDTQLTAEADVTVQGYGTGVHVGVQ